MIGVVLWSDHDDRKAVFWCEDHGDLAYYDASTDGFAGKTFMSPGDMISFDVSISGKVRRATNAAVVETSVCNGLQDHLKQTAGLKSQRTDRRLGSNVVDILPPLTQRRRA